MENGYINPFALEHAEELTAAIQEHRGYVVGTSLGIALPAALVHAVVSINNPQSSLIDGAFTASLIFAGVGLLALERIKRTKDFSIADGKIDPLITRRMRKKGWNIAAPR